jgi:hypothetical protein
MVRTEARPFGCLPRSATLTAMNLHLLGYVKYNEFKSPLTTNLPAQRIREAVSSYTAAKLDLVRAEAGGVT